MFFDQLRRELYFCPVGMCFDELLKLVLRIPNDPPLLPASMGTRDHVPVLSEQTFPPGHRRLADPKTVGQLLGRGAPTRSFESGAGIHRHRSNFPDQCK